MDIIFRCSVVAVLHLTFAGVAAAQSWDLASDWSDGFNPNGVWSYNGSVDTPITSSHSDWDPTGSDVFGSEQPAWAAAPYPQNDHVPMLFKRVSNTSAIDIPIGRVGMHGNEFNDPPIWVGVVWTCPAAATINVSGGVWYAHTGVSRKADWQIRLNETILTAGSVEANDGSSSSVPHDLRDGSGGASAIQGLSMSAGDTITLEFISLETWAAFVGVDLAIAAEAVSALPHSARHVMDLSQNRPNPFRAATQITFTTTREGPVSVRVYDVQSRLVRTVVDGQLAAGVHTYTWDGRTGTRTPVPSGVYFYELLSEGHSLHRKMVLLR